MQWLHELGHISTAILTGGVVTYVELRPWHISRTDISPNHAPLLVAWGGPVGGILFPVILWVTINFLQPAWNRKAQFLVGFCCIANGLYIGLGAVDRIGDCQELRNYGAALWQLWLFGLLATIAGTWIWHDLTEIHQIQKNVG